MLGQRRRHENGIGSALRVYRVINVWFVLLIVSWKTPHKFHTQKQVIYYANKWLKSISPDND